MYFIFLLLSFLISIKSFSVLHRTTPYIGKANGLHKAAQSLASVAIKPFTEEDIEKIDSNMQRWFFNNFKRRADMALISRATLSHEISFELWKTILVSFLILEKEYILPVHTTVIAFPNITLDNNLTLESLQNLGNMIEDRLNTSSVFFQPDIKREIKFFLRPSTVSSTGEARPPLVMLSLDSIRTDSVEDITETMDAFVPTTEDIWTNDIPGFPFDSVFDFISEINRPADVDTIANLKFNYNAQDLRLDTSKTKSKKDPKEFLLMMNVRMTRLQKWRDFLISTISPINSRDIRAFPQQTKYKYQSLQSLAKLDPKRALDTQYDKRKVFVGIIDKWMDRLKKVFKWRYISKRKPVDFQKLILESDWRKDIVKTVHTLRTVPFLELEGPEFTPGVPRPLFTQDIPVYRTFEMDRIFYETTTWLRHIETIKVEAGATDMMLGNISQHVYSRALVTERAMHDVWYSLSSWLKDLDEASSESKRYPNVIVNATGAVEALSSGAYDRRLRAASTNTSDHTDDFLETLSNLNKVSRVCSTDQAKSVKEVYKNWNILGQELIDWWTILANDVDVTDELDELAKRGKPISWSNVINGIVMEKVYNVASNDPSEMESQDREKTVEKWIQYKRVLQYAEWIKARIPWTDSKEQMVENAVHTLPSKLSQEFAKEPVEIHFETEATDVYNTKKSMLLVLPRFFPGFAKDNDGALEELNAFLEFSQIVTEDINQVVKDRKITVLPLHPLLIDDEGDPIYHRRSPHPALVFSIE